MYAAGCFYRTGNHEVRIYIIRVNFDSVKENLIGWKDAKVEK